MVQPTLHLVITSLTPWVDKAFLEEEKQQLNRVVNKITVSAVQKIVK